MDSLPVLVLENIVQYLSNQELAACCASSIGWRETFDQDAFWKPRCDKMIADHLRVTECEVEPGFVSPEEGGNTLSPISEWRMCFLREAHLWRNWRQRWCVNQAIKDKNWIEVEFFCFLTGTHVLIKQKYDNPEFWDVSKTPLRLGNVFTLFDNNGELYIFEVFDGSKFAVLQGITLYIYEISSPIVDPWKLIYSITLSTLDYQLSRNPEEAFVSGNLLVIISKEGSVFCFDLNSKILSKFQILHSTINRAYYIHDIVQSESKSSEFGIVMAYNPKQYVGEDIYEDLNLKSGFYIFIYSPTHKDFPYLRKHLMCCNDTFGRLHCVLNDNYLCTLHNSSFEITDFHTGEVMVDVQVYLICWNYFESCSWSYRWESNPTCEILSPLTMVMDAKFDSTSSRIFNKLFGIRSHSVRMFLQQAYNQIPKYVCLRNWREHTRSKCNQVCTYVIDRGLTVSKFW